MPEPRKPIKRREPGGRIEPRYARELLEKARETRNDDQTDRANRAFLAGTRTAQPLAEELAEAFVETATTGEEAERRRLDRITPDEDGGPFVISPAEREFAAGTDASNIREALREPLPRTSKAEP
jgi:hypothetical protein